MKKKAPGSRCRCLCAVKGRNGARFQTNPRGAIHCLLLRGLIKGKEKKAARLSEPSIEALSRRPRCCSQESIDKFPSVCPLYRLPSKYSEHIAYAEEQRHDKKNALPATAQSSDTIQEKLVSYYRGRKTGTLAIADAKKKTA